MGTPDKVYEKEIQRGEFDKRAKQRQEQDVDKEPSKKPSLGDSFAKNEARWAEQVEDGELTPEEYEKKLVNLEFNYDKKKKGE